MQTKISPEAAADEVLSLFERFGNMDYIGEQVSQTEHMCQCACLALDACNDDEVVLAAFLHDRGHLYAFVKPADDMNGLGAVDHERLGADYLRSLGFSEKVARLVEGHVAAKRYLTYSSPVYYSSLSESSRQTLEFQGGRMSADEAAEFEKDELFQLMVHLRKWDDMGKQLNIPLPPLNRFRTMLIRHLAHR